MLNDGSTDEIEEKAHVLADCYTELSESELRAEVKRLRCQTNSFKDMVVQRDNIADWNVLELPSWIVKWAYTESVPNWTTVMRIYLCLWQHVSVASPK